MELVASLVFEIQLTGAAVKAVLAMLDDCCCLLLFDSASRGLTSTKPATKTITPWLSTDALRGPHWLLAYEVMLQGWIAAPKPTDHISQDPVFEFLRKNGVRFYDTSILAQVKGAGEEDYQSKAGWTFDELTGSKKAEPKEGEDEEPEEDEDGYLG